ncbi:MAG: tRNA 2-thiouridine(34) synthase MnmA [Planctomycetota bacterium]|jgi:tRNA-specific 2-thiouridylase
MSATARKVLLAMSGGVDSSVAAALLTRAGHEVIGVFMRLGSPGEELDTLVPADHACSPTKIGKQGCCSINDANDARVVASELGIPFYVSNFKQDFGRIMDYFVEEYAQGRTPNPCVRCNDWLKFGKLHELAQQLGCDAVASGHYARLDRSHAAGPRLMRGTDTGKDQSYVLFGVGREQLDHMMLPIGDFEKSHVRDMAQDLGLPVFDKPDSQEICFVHDNDYAGFVARRDPSLETPGPIITIEGERVGTHEGQHRYTIGQRRGLGIASHDPLYVVARDASTNTVIVGTRHALACEGCHVGETNWLIDPPNNDAWHQCVAKYRYNTPAAEARFRLLGDTEDETHSGRSGRFEVRFDSPQDAIAPGQALVLYDADDPDWVIAGGWIERSLP